MSGLAAIADRVSHRTLAGRALRLPLRLVPRSAVVRVLGGINRGMRWVAGAGPTNACWLGNYEEDHTPALRQVVRPGMVAYDLGANAGFYTLALSKLVGDSGRVFSFEPDARSVSYLRRHIHLNKIENVTVVQAAISSSAQIVAFDGWTVIQKSTYLVPAVSLDEFIGAGNPVPDFIKMDIEGAEFAALEGAQDLLSRAQPTWLLATHSRELTESCKGFLRQRGYRFTGFDCLSDPGEVGDFMVLPSEHE
jgi:FkbM family methyltransferase